MVTRRRLTPKERVAEYVDSPAMTHRVKFKKQLAARISGNHGVYRTLASVTKKVSGDCTCPSGQLPCKHVQALRLTWDIHPESFLDLDEFLVEQPKAELVKAIGEILVDRPEYLSAFDVLGFAPQEEDQSGW